MLAEIYGWFTEGFDTADLKEAKALLEELSGEGRGLHQDPLAWAGRGVDNAVTCHAEQHRG